MEFNLRLKKNIVLELVALFVAVAAFVYYLGVSDPSREDIAASIKRGVSDGCLNIAGGRHEISSEFEPIYWQLTYVCRIDLVASQHKTDIRGFYFPILLGTVPLIVAFYRGRAGLTSLILVATFAGMCSFISFSTIKSMEGDFRYLNALEDNATKTGLVAFWRAGLPSEKVISEATKLGILPVLENAGENYMTLISVEGHLEVSRYLSAILAIIGAWAFTVILGRRLDPNRSEFIR